METTTKAEAERKQAELGKLAAGFEDRVAAADVRAA
jgi:hypothetical protein